MAPYTLEAEHEGLTYTVHVDQLRVPRCGNCGELLFDDAANEQISDALRHQIGLLSPFQIRRNREALGLTPGQLARHLALPETTLSRYETGGQIPERAHDCLMRLYFSFPEVRTALANEAGRATQGTHAVQTDREVLSSLS